MSIRVKLPPFQNVGANLTAVIPAIPQGMTYKSISLRLGGTTFTKAMITGLRLWLGGKKIWDATGSHIDAINSYFRATANAAYLNLHFANPRAKNPADHLIGAIDTSSIYSNFSMEVDIGGATAPTLEAYARVAAPIAKDRPYRGMLRTLIKGVHPAPSAAEFSLPVALGSRQGGLVRALHLFHTGNVTKLQVLKDSFHLIQEGAVAVLQAEQNEFARVTQANLLNGDFVLEDFDAMSVPTLRPDGSPAAFETKVTVSAADTVTSYTDMLQTLDAA